MFKIKYGDEVRNINCNEEFCEECCYLEPQKCTLFDIMIDHVRGGHTNSSGWKRCQQCIDAEVTHGQ